MAENNPTQMTIGTDTGGGGGSGTNPTVVLDAKDSASLLWNDFHLKDLVGLDFSSPENMEQHKAAYSTLKAKKYTMKGLLEGVLGKCNPRSKHRKIINKMRPLIGDYLLYFEQVEPAAAENNDDDNTGIVNDGKPPSTEEGAEKEVAIPSTEDGAKKEVAVPSEKEDAPETFAGAVADKKRSAEEMQPSAEEMQPSAGGGVVNNALREALGEEESDTGAAAGGGAEEVPFPVPSSNNALREALEEEESNTGAAVGGGVPEGCPPVPSSLLLMPACSLADTPAYVMTPSVPQFQQQPLADPPSPSSRRRRRRNSRRT